MEKGSSALAIALRWLAALWMVSWALYVGLWDSARLITLAGTIRCMAILLVPAVLAFWLSCALNVRGNAIRDDDRVQLPK
jgi:hypothetical protein